MRCNLEGRVDQRNCMSSWYIVWENRRTCHSSGAVSYVSYVVFLVEGNWLDTGWMNSAISHLCLALAAVLLSKHAWLRTFASKRWDCNICILSTSGCLHSSDDHFLTWPGRFPRFQGPNILGQLMDSELVHCLLEILGFRGSQLLWEAAQSACQEGWIWGCWQVGRCASLPSLFHEPGISAQEVCGWVFLVHEGMRLERMSPRLLESSLSSLSSLRIVFNRAHLKTGGSGIALFKQSMWRAQWVSVCKAKIRTSAVWVNIVFKIPHADPSSWGASLFKASKTCGLADLRSRPNTFWHCGGDISILS